MASISALTVGMDDETGVAQRLRAAMGRAMRERDRRRTATLRSALAAIDNAGAVPLDEADRAGAIESAALGVGAAEVPRRQLSESDIARVVEQEIGELRSAAAHFTGSPDEAAALRGEAYALEALLGESTPGLLTFGLNVTLDGCVDHREGIADEETHAYFTRLMAEHGAMLWGRVTYELMEDYWPAVARGDIEAPPAIRRWALDLEAKPKYVVSATRTDFPWANSHHVDGNLAESVRSLKGATPGGILLGSGRLATALDRLDLIDEYRLLVHPRIVGHGPRLYEGGLVDTRRLELLSIESMSNGAVALRYRRAG